MPLKYSKHAREQMIARGVSEKDVEEGIKRGSKQLQKPNKILSETLNICGNYYFLKKMKGADLMKI